MRYSRIVEGSWTALLTARWHAMSAIWLRCCMAARSTIQSSFTPKRNTLPGLIAVPNSGSTGSLSTQVPPPAWPPPDPKPAILPPCGSKTRMYQMLGSVPCQLLTTACSLLTSTMPGESRMRSILSSSNVLLRPTLVKAAKRCWRSVSRERKRKGTGCRSPCSTCSPGITITGGGGGTITSTATVSVPLSMRDNVPWKPSGWN
mmetsp:Transcript_14196/g.29825  ORF Transcript_14196/g.29825 Transcript_14196/m.29825 type:complete len:203 (-) Transcript_14196:840-1448(-)